MSAEKIIERIKSDTEQQITQLRADAEKQSQNIIKNAKAEAQKEAEDIMRHGQLESENTKKILISKASQEIRRDMMNAREELIAQCFQEALQQLKALPENQYRKFITSLIQQGKKRLGENCTVQISRPLDKDIAQQQNLLIQGTLQSIGGVMMQSADGKITIDYTFERLLSRKKDEIRIQVGKLLFPS